MLSEISEYTYCNLHGNIQLEKESRKAENYLYLRLFPIISKIEFCVGYD